MPFETPSLPVLIKRTQSDLAGDSLRQSDAQVLARTLGGAAYGLYGYLDWIAEQILPDKADESTLERIAALRLNQPRKPAQAATGSVSFSASAGAVLDVDTLVAVQRWAHLQSHRRAHHRQWHRTAPQSPRSMPAVRAMPTPVWC